ncbi:hypothetical protein Q069_01628 [Pseudomonas aeruginosa BL15]|nr:hypothetical protein Q069_01628 [Pseudomonas aeruginosa BL15]WBI98310.1 hypothetical protein PALA52_02260 [Pseudomonas aeruginosa]VFT60900.1 Uncharacterised protein [Pseudomonas aeruginosa]
MIEMPLQRIFHSIESAGEWADLFARSQTKV